MCQGLHKRNRKGPLLRRAHHTQCRDFPFATISKDICYSRAHQGIKGVYCFEPREESHCMDVEVILQKGAAAWCKEPEESVSRDGGRMLYLMQQDYIMSDGRGPLCSHL